MLAVASFTVLTQNWLEANMICIENGLRLCTPNEVMHRESEGTGCGFDAKRIWTSGIKCPLGQFETLPGSPDYLDAIPAMCLPASARVRPPGYLR